jgi:hypothetical protein
VISLCSQQQSVIGHHLLRLAYRAGILFRHLHEGEDGAEDGCSDVDHSPACFEEITLVYVHTLSIGSPTNEVRVTAGTGIDNTEIIAQISVRDKYIRAIERIREKGQETGV